MKTPLTATAYAAKVGKSRQRILALLLEGRIPGASLIGKSKTYRGVWIIPASAVIKPVKRRKDT